MPYNIQQYVYVRYVHVPIVWYKATPFCFLIAISSSLHLHNVEVVRSVCICHLFSIFIKKSLNFLFFRQFKNTEYERLQFS